MWVTYGSTESGDDLQPIVWRNKPKEKDVKKIYQRMYPDEYEEVGFVHFTTEEAILGPDLDV